MREVWGAGGSRPNGILLKWRVGKECVPECVSACAFNSYWERGFHRLLCIYMALIPGRTGNREKRREVSNMKYASMEGNSKFSIHMRCQVRSPPFQCSNSGNNVGNCTAVRRYFHGQSPHHMCSFLYLLQPPQSDHTVPILSVSTRSANVSPPRLHTYLFSAVIEMACTIPCQLPADRTWEPTTADQSAPTKGSSTDLYRGRRNSINLRGDKMLHLPRAAAVLT